MAVKLRLMRMGKKKQPYYRLVAADSRSPRDGRFIEILGTYDPRSEPSRVVIDADKAARWLSSGAKPTDTVARLLAQAGLTPAPAVPTPRPASAAPAAPSPPAPPAAPVAPAAPPASPVSASPPPAEAPASAPVEEEAEEEADSAAAPPSSAGEPESEPES